MFNFNGCDTKYHLTGCGMSPKLPSGCFKCKILYGMKKTCQWLSLIHAEQKTPTI